MTDTHTTAHIPDEDVKAMPERIYAAKSDRPCIVCMDEKFRDYDVEYVRADIAAIRALSPAEPAQDEPTLISSKIETIYRACVSYEASPDVVEKIENKAFDLSGDLDVETMCGNAACSPHITAEGTDGKAVAAWVSKLESYIRRNKKAELLSPTTEAGK